MKTARDRARGALVGLAVGDAVGTAVEFKPPGSFPPVTEMTGGGPFGLKAGQFTDDTSMALCLAESLSEIGRFDVADHLVRYVRWWRSGHLSSTGRCFDIGNATRAALARFEASGDPGLAATDTQAAGNGSLMRLAPAALYARGDAALAAELGRRSSLATHGAPQATDACRLFAVMLTRAVAGGSKSELLDPSLWSLGRLHTEIEPIARGSYLRREPPQIKGGGYVAHCLEAALWAFARSESFAEGCLLAVNLGDDADTTAAVFGQIAGAHYGESGIPAEWREKLALWDTIDHLAEELARWQTIPRATGYPRRGLHSYWVEPGVLLAGEYPGARTRTDAARKLSSLLEEGVRLFVDLTEEGESGLEPYAPLLYQLADEKRLAVDYARYPIPDVSVPSDAETIIGILDELAAAERDGAPAYVHCWGGVGRTGVVVACHQVERGYPAERALDRVEELRKGTSKAQRRSPETSAQRNYVRAWPQARSVERTSLFDEIPNRRYTFADLPERITSIDELAPVALSLNGYRSYSDKTIGEFANAQRDVYAEQGELPSLGLAELRFCLFFLQRALRHTGYDPWEEDGDFALEARYANALLGAMRARLACDEEPDEEEK